MPKHTWSEEQDDFVLEGMRLNKSNRWISERTNKTIGAVKSRKRTMLAGAFDAEEVPREALKIMHNKMVAAFHRAHPELEVLLK